MHEYGLVSTLVCMNMA